MFDDFSTIKVKALAVGAIALATCAAGCIGHAEDTEGEPEETVGSQAGLSASYFLDRVQHFSETPTPGWTTCQHRYVTLPQLPTGYYYAWAEYFQAQDEGYWTAYDLKYHGKFYWTVCVQAIKNTYYNYVIWSLITEDNAACQNNGNCTTHFLPNHYFRLDQSGYKEWGSEIYVTWHI